MRCLIDCNYFKYIFIIQSHGQKIICKIHDFETYIETCEIHSDELIRCITIDFNFKNIGTMYPYFNYKTLDQDKNSHTQTCNLSFGEKSKKIL